MVSVAILKGNLGVTAHVTDIDGTWQDLTKHVNRMALNLTGRSTELFVARWIFDTLASSDRCLPNLY